MTLISVCMTPHCPLTTIPPLRCHEIIHTPSSTSALWPSDAVRWDRHLPSSIFFSLDLHTPSRLISWHNILSPSCPICWHDYLSLSPAVPETLRCQIPRDRYVSLCLPSAARACDRLAPHLLSRSPLVKDSPRERRWGRPQGDGKIIREGRTLLGDKMKRASRGGDC
jgi:hypothetical protein